MASQDSGALHRKVAAWRDLRTRDGLTLARLSAEEEHVERRTAEEKETERSAWACTKAKREGSEAGRHGGCGRRPRGWRASAKQSTKPASFMPSRSHSLISSHGILLMYLNPVMTFSVMWQLLRITCEELHIDTHPSLDF